MTAKKPIKHKRAVKSALNKGKKRFKKIVAHAAKPAINDESKATEQNVRPEIPPQVQKFYDEPQDEFQPVFNESELTGELPIDYDENKLVLQFADPRTAYVYWNISLQERCRLRMGRGGHLVLRLHNISYGTKDEFWFSEDTNTCLLALEHVNCIYRAELGYYSSTRYSCLAISNAIEVPADHVSEQPAERVEEPVVIYVEEHNENETLVNAEPDSDEETATKQKIESILDDSHVEILYSDTESTDIDFTGYVDFIPAELKNNPSSGELPFAVGIGKNPEKQKMREKTDKPSTEVKAPIKGEPEIVSPDFISPDFMHDKPTSKMENKVEFIPKDFMKNKPTSGNM